VASRGDARRLLDDLREAAGQAKAVTFAEKVTLHSVPASGNPVLSDAATMELLRSRLHALVAGVAIVADGQVVIGLPDQQAAVRTLALLQSAFAPPGPGVTTVFRENVRLENRDIAVERMAASPQVAVEKIRAGLRPKGVHEVKPGETAWKIALDSHVPLSRLAQANPGLDINRIRAGDRINIPGEGAPITVIAHQDIEQETSARGGRSVLVMRVTYENGAVVAREVVGHRRVGPAEAPPSQAERGPRRLTRARAGRRTEIVP